MAKLYFSYGTMGSSKTAQALMLRFSYLERGQKVLLLKPAIDTRDGENLIKSRIGLEAPVIQYSTEDNLLDLYNFEFLELDCVVVDEVHFSTKEQIEQLKYIAEEFGIPVHTFGLRANFKTELFEGSKRLFEIADSITEIKSPCHCGKKTIVNARYKGRKIIYDGESIVIGGNDQYKSLCYKCWREGNLGK
ncbi:MAG: thymidine kinase [Bacilli bacterium]|nr:thymidine kinase [Bacilli bacterium]MDD3305043.1 thymidine kinase [Bacilli bacterium]MDD4053468.1 thymidine kinase [Bacilli bacterium]MDD4411762.1 thymidine kinase [Bacilli bacterium]